MKSTKWIMLLCASVMACSMSVSAAPFDAAYYAENNPDVVKEVGNDVSALAYHYYMYGIEEGRAGNAEDAAAGKGKTELVGFREFDAEYYALQNPDVVAACGADAMSLYMHYVNYGAAEGRMPSEKAKAEADQKGQGNDQDNQKDDPYARFKTAENTVKRKKSKSKSKEEATHTLTYQSNGDGTHDIICSVPGCSQGHNKTVACDDISYEQDSEEHHQHGDDIHYVICKDCGGKWEEACKIVDYKWIDRKKHEVTCGICDGKWIVGHCPEWNSELQKLLCEGCEGECER